MSIVTWLVAGAFVGSAASHYMTNTRPAAIAFNVVVALLGAAIVQWVVAPMLGVGPGFGGLAFVVSASGAAALLFCVHFVQQAVAR